MDLARIVAALRGDLAAIAAVGDEETADSARRLSVALQGALALRLVDALAEAARELNAQLPAGRVEVRLAGPDPELVFVEDDPAGARAVGDDAFTARITLRLPDVLKASVEAAASREGVSTNTWLVRAISRAVSGPTGRSGNRLTGFARS